MHLSSDRLPLLLELEDRRVAFAFSMLAHGLALAVALSLCRTEAAHREALAVVADLVGRVAAGTDLADAAAALFRDLSDVVGA